MCEGSNFSIPCQYLLSCLWFKQWMWHPSGCEVVSHCGFDLHFTLESYFIFQILCTAWFLLTDVLSIQTSVPSQKVCIYSNGFKAEGREIKKADFKIFLGFAFLRHSIRQIPPSSSFRVELSFKYIFWLINRNFDIGDKIPTLWLSTLKEKLKSDLYIYFKVQ